MIWENYVLFFSYIRTIIELLNYQASLSYYSDILDRYISHYIFSSDEKSPLSVYWSADLTRHFLNQGLLLCFPREM